MKISRIIVIGSIVTPNTTTIGVRILFARLFWRSRRASSLVWHEVSWFLLKFLRNELLCFNLRDIAKYVQYMIARGRTYDNKVNITTYTCSNNNDGHVGPHHFPPVGSSRYLTTKFKGRENTNNDIIHMKKAMILALFKGVLLIFSLGFRRKTILRYLSIAITVMHQTDAP